MNTPSRAECEEWDRPAHCPLRSCPEWLPPVPGDLLRRRPACGRVLVDVAAALGGCSTREVAWWLGVSETTVRTEVRGAVKKVGLRLGVVRGEVVG